VCALFNLLPRSGCVRVPIFDHDRGMQGGAVTVRLMPESGGKWGDVGVATITLHFAHPKQRVRWRMVDDRSESPPSARIELDALSSSIRETVNDVIACSNAGALLTDADLRLVWQWRRAMASRPDSLALVLRSAPTDVSSLSETISEVHALLNIR
jgi:hypothetical protein